MPIYDYTCTSGHTSESRQGYNIAKIPCPLCGETAYRESIYVPFIITETGVGARAQVPYDEKRYNISLFQEACAEREYAHKKAEGVMQRELEPENLWARAKRKADAIRAGKAPPLKPQFVS